MQKAFLGRETIRALKEIIEQHDARRVLLVTGKGSYLHSGARAKIDPLLAGVEVAQFNQFSVNPKIEDVEAGIARLQVDDFDLVIAVGGGSVIDMAKLVNVLSCQPERPLDYITGERALVHRGLPLVAIPTTAGSGSEATRFAVIYVDQVKFSLSDDALLPSHAIVDPQFTFSLSDRSAAISGMDALSQAIESFWSVRSMVESRGYAADAIQTILRVLPSAVEGDEEAREAMAQAAHLAGKAINITTTTAPHALSYHLTTHFNIPHGHAVALTLGEMLLVNGQPAATQLSVDLDSEEYAQRMKALFDLLGCESAQACRDEWYNLMKSIGLETSLYRAGGVMREDLQPMVASVNRERLQNNPVRLSAEELYALLLRIEDNG